MRRTLSSPPFCGCSMSQVTLSKPRLPALVHTLCWEPGKMVTSSAHCLLCEGNRAAHRRAARWARCWWPVGRCACRTPPPA